MRGHGRSGKPVDSASYESQKLSEDFNAVLKGFQLRRPFILARLALSSYELPLSGCWPILTTLQLTGWYFLSYCVNCFFESD